MPLKDPAPLPKKESRNVPRRGAPKPPPKPKSSLRSMPKVPNPVPNGSHAGWWDAIDDDDDDDDARGPTPLNSANMRSKRLNGSCPCACAFAPNDVEKDACPKCASSKGSRPVRAVRGGGEADAAAATPPRSYSRRVAGSRRVSYACATALNSSVSPPARSGCECSARVRYAVCEGRTMLEGMVSNMPECVDVVLASPHLW